jgi:predicted dehydrogenase
MVGYPLRFNTAFVNLKRQIESGMLGHIEIANGTYISSGPFMHRAEGYAPVPVPDWWFRKELTGGGALIDLGSHLLNLLRWYFGEITDIKSQFDHHYGLDLEDGAICLAKFDSGTTAVVEVGWFSQAYKLKVELSGTVGNASADHVPSGILSVVTQMLTTGTSRFYWPHLEELRYFITCLTQDFSPSPSGDDGLKDLEAISLAYQNQISLN